MESIFSILLFIGFLHLMMRFGCGARTHSGGCGHSSHRHNRPAENEHDQAISAAKQLTRDPVCSMEIEPARAWDSTQYGADTFYFCSKDCYLKFKERPEYFAEIVRMEKRYVA